VLRPESPLPAMKEQPESVERSPSKAGLTRHQTAPSLKLKDLQVEASSTWGCGSSAKSPRTLQGAVRKASQVEMIYPGTPCLPPPPPTHRATSSTALDGSRPGSPLRKPKRHRTVTGTPDELFPPSSPEDARSASLRRSMKLLESLYSMRRVGNGGDKKKDPDAVEDPEDTVEEELSAPGVLRRSKAMQDVLMTKILSDVDDDEAKLAQVEEGLTCIQQGQVPILGGSRHASSVLAARTLVIVKRKRSLLKQLEDRLKAFEEAQAHGLEITQMMKEDTLYEPPEVLMGMDTIAEECTHRPGNPADANKSDFKNFSEKFGLPQDHWVFKRMQETCTNAIDWWAQAALSEVEAGTDPEVVAKMLTLSSNIMGANDNAAGIKCKKILADVLAESCMNMAKAMQSKDKKAMEDGNGKATAEAARMLSDTINAEIRSAVAMGAEPSNHMMKQAKLIATELLTEEKERIAQKVYDYAREQKERDEVMAIQTQEAMIVGPASWAAESIEKEIKKAINNGVPAIHPLMMEASKLSKKLRDEDVGRRRQTAKAPGLFVNTPGNRLYRNVRDLDVTKRISMAMSTSESETSFSMGPA